VATNSVSVVIVQAGSDVVSSAIDADTPSCGDGCAVLRVTAAAAVVTAVSSIDADARVVWSTRDAKLIIAAP